MVGDIIMARIFIDGFESGGYDLYASSYGSEAVISTAGLDMNGDYCLDLTANYANVQKTITATDEIYAAFQWRPTAPSTHQPMLLLYSGATYLAALFRNNADNNLDAYRGTTVIDSGSEVISNTTTYLIEIYFKLADAGGRFVVKVNGVTDIDFTGDTKDGADATFDGVRLGYYSSSFHAKAYFDNLVVDDSAWIGETFIQSLVPTGIGNSSAWTPSAGDNYACVDEIPANDADSVLSQAADDTDTYVTEDLAGSIETKCVQIQSRCRITAGVSKNIKLVVRVNGTDYLSGDKAVAGTAKSLFNLWENNPDDAAAWEKADVNGMEIGVKSGATINDITSYQALAQVEWIVGVSWTGKICGVTNPAKINGVAVANIASVMGQ